MGAGQIRSGNLLTTIYPHPGYCCGVFLGHGRFLWSLFDRKDPSGPSVFTSTMREPASSALLQVNLLMNIF